ncbi:TetR/AcrR family transcriptional regulator [Nonomuraea sp. B10E15]|uniref:TetR/AcrR family transcriptional regulator n=1 Tax=unclassified Nonomuraea TaxID=2593643 RepID=UPI00325F6E14
MDVPPERSRRSAADLVKAAHEGVIAETAERGLGTLTMECVAKRTRIAKTSLYRRWPTVEDLLLEALHDAHPAEEVSPSADDLRGDLIKALNSMVTWMMSPTAQAAGAVLAERNRRPELFDALYERVFDLRGRRFTETVLRHYAARGAIDAARVTPVVVEIGEALVTKFAYDDGVPPDQARIAEIIDQAILPAVQAGPCPPEQNGQR